MPLLKGLKNSYPERAPTIINIILTFATVEYFSFGFYIFEGLLLALIEFSKHLYFHYITLQFFCIQRAINHLRKGVILEKLLTISENVFLEVKIQIWKIKRRKRSQT